MEKISLVEDVSKLTTIPQKALSSLLEKFNYCIVDTIKEDKLAGKDISNIVIDKLGTISISYKDNQLKYRFVPSEELNDAIIKLLKEGLNSLEANLENSLINKITYLYKNLI